ncbi:membrane protein insertase YidC [Ferrimonas marina]|uniref:Membrane protein insertase YidC n=1 Tax=Ferrimonas marina TaxID=299255 RepID=A0A1M5ZHU0_9GAMM|nr:membrane protein insertase YidC [Ferrimonas marina]SHI23718.1 YidC/Oxa1 family membrane protein insertase [Ferrimonas marina]
MESQRNLILIGLLFVSFLLWQNWQIDQNPPAEPVQAQSAPAVNADVPQATQSGAVPTASETVSANLIQVQTDTLNLTIDTQGGDVIAAALPQHKVEQDSDEALQILETSGNFNYVAQSGLIGAQGPDSQQRPVYQVEAAEYQLQDGQDSLVVPLLFTDANGIQFEKRFTFTRGQYDVRIDYVIRNQSEQNAQVQMYAQLKQSLGKNEGSMFMPTYRGAAYGTADTRYEKYSFDKIQKGNLAQLTEGGWIAMLQHYFVSAWVPSATERNELYTRFINSNEAIIGVKQDSHIIAPGTEQTLGATLYIGPKDQDALSALSPSLNLVVDYGWLWFIAQPLHSLLQFLHSLAGNWGVAIILMTLIIRGLMYPLTKAQYTSMAKMRNLQPKIADLKERFGDDRQRMSQAMMELYQKEKVNPMGGCFPLLLQFPIFIAFYWVLLEGVELRHAPFFLWITDLSVKDPYYVLPILMGISMFAMQKLQPTMANMDPMQQKIMQYMPVMFTVFFLWFPSGLVLYWLMGNLVALAQQVYIYRQLDAQGLK